LRVLGVGFGIAVIIGNTIGAGIFRAPGSIAQNLPHPWLFLGVWILGGLYALLGAISLAELGAMLPKSGGQYVFARYALGEYAGFVVGWSDWISTCGSTAAVALLIGTIYRNPNPNDCRVPAVPIAVTVALVFAALQWRGVVWGSTTQNLTSLMKTLAFLILIGAAFLFGRGGSLANSETLSPSTIGWFTAIVLSLQSVIYTYDGWSGVIYFSEEVTNPGREVPRAMFGGVLNDHRDLSVGKSGAALRTPHLTNRRAGFCGGRGCPGRFWPSRQHGLLGLNNPFNAERDQCLPFDGHPRMFAISRDGLFASSGATVTRVALRQSRWASAPGSRCCSLCSDKRLKE
jgi:amino acid transporter